MKTRPIPFRPFDEDGLVRIYSHGFLPHWRQEGCTYFVTFRLDDSIPRSILDQWSYDRRCWLAARGIDTRRHGWHQEVAKLSRNDLRSYERHFAGKLHECLDRGFGQSVLKRRSCGEIVAEALGYFHGHRANTGDYVVMPNHVHLLLTPYRGCSLEHFLHSIKSYTANRINRVLARRGIVWMKESYDHIVRNADELVRIQQYIRVNPAKAQLATGDYILSLAEYQISLPTTIPVSRSCQQ